MQHRACKVVHTRSLPTTQHPRSRRSARSHTSFWQRRTNLEKRALLGEYRAPQRRSNYLIRTHSSIVRVT
ncbi:uncharacterized protein M421DRAFT_327575 [Didymella exigua CBS 183.55]|uniref:Uncharacterized protein n=1 Tax=Didymella exigua CBS 183.55 TaxID=1150837 RepID=A0A6A5R562_9PLEO|nr:uncharacterized protein M421DRAFT_327575 [Didymella exigua CBS 183.55]KAF1923261.1 hypothetical protein M421DRAFT_327575 [Didymella exigua CBS 183.55]